MKKISGILLAISLVLGSCVKNSTPETPLNQQPADTATALYSGNFSSGPYGMVTGKAAVYRQNGQYKLALENLTSSNGPDLHVYLSRERLPVNYIDLGSLQSTNGNQLYLLGTVPDFSLYKYALIHCQRFNHLFGSAELR